MLCLNLYCFHSLPLPVCSQVNFKPMTEDMVGIIVLVLVLICFCVCQNLSPIWEKIRCPVLMLHGQHSDLVLPEFTKRYAFMCGIRGVLLSVCFR